MGSASANSSDIKIFNFLGWLVVALFTLLCAAPFVLMISGSFSSNASILREGYSLWPKDFTTEAYQYLLRYPGDLIRAYSVTIMITLCGTLSGLFLISMTAYVLHRKDFRYRNYIAFFLYFTTIFQGGLIPWYMMITNVLQIRDTYFVLVWNMIMNPFLIILMRSFMQAAIPSELIESSKMDGANDFSIFIRVILPLSAPAIATVGLFLALAYWNDWFNAALFIDDRQKYPLQFLLYNALSASQYITQFANAEPLASINEVPGETVKLAISLVSMGPILLLYPFVQRYFVKGITLGAVKG